MNNIPQHLTYENILLKHGRCIINSRKECDISTLIGHIKINSPVFPANMKAIINEDICEIFDKAGWFYIFHRTCPYSQIKDFLTRVEKDNWNIASVSIGVKDSDYELVQWIKDHYKKNNLYITIDVALSWQDQVERMIKYIKEHLPAAYLIVGNGDHPDWIRWLEDLGVDAAKVNIGISQSCRTRQFTGFGSTSIGDLYRMAQAKNKIKIISDGGITKCATREPAIGDIAKAIRFGANYVCSGFLFSQCIDSPAIREGYYGNSTAKAKGHSSNVEGTIIHTDTNGLTLKEQIKLIEDSLKSSVSYSGGKNLDSLKACDYIII